MTQSLEYISKISYKHVNNNHKKLKFNQLKELKTVDEALEKLLIETKEAFNSRSFQEIERILNNRGKVYDLVKDKIQKQVERTRTEESSPKNTTLYFSILLETKDLLTATMNLLDEYSKSFDSKIPPARLTETREEEE